MTQDTVYKMKPTTMTALGDKVGDDMYDLAKGPDLNPFIPVEEFGYIPNYEMDGGQITDLNEARYAKERILWSEIMMGDRPSPDESGNFPTGYENFIPEGMNDVSNVIHLDSYERLPSFESSSRFRIPTSARR